PDGPRPDRGRRAGRGGRGDVPLLRAVPGPVAAGGGRAPVPLQPARIRLGPGGPPPARRAGRRARRPARAGGGGVPGGRLTPPLARTGWGPRGAGRCGFI